MSCRIMPWPGQPSGALPSFVYVDGDGAAKLPTPVSSAGAGPQGRWYRRRCAATPAASAFSAGGQVSPEQGEEDGEHLR